MGQMADTLTSRDAVRRAVVDDIIGRAEAAAMQIEAEDGSGPIVAGAFVSMGTLRQIGIDHLTVTLPPPSEKYAEVTTPASITVHALCPECDLPVVIVGRLETALTVDDDGAEIAVKWKAKKKAHQHDQLPLPEAEGQTTITDAVEALRLRVLGAVATVSDVWGAPQEEGDPAPPPTLVVIAGELEPERKDDEEYLATLSDTLYEYAEEGLVELVKGKRGGPPPHYVLTEAGIEALNGTTIETTTETTFEVDDDQDPA